jgi:CRP-like cAMP-binding protein
VASNKDRVRRLETVPLFSSLTKKELQLLADRTEDVSYPAGHVVAEEGAPATAAYVIASGTVVIKRNGRKVGTAGPGDIIGELALLADANRSATVTCETDCTFVRLDRSGFADTLMKTPNLMHKILQAVASRVREIDKRYYG